MRAIILVAVCFVGALLFSEERSIGSFYNWDWFPSRVNIDEHADGSLQLSRGDLSHAISDAEIYLPFEHETPSFSSAEGVLVNFTTEASRNAPQRIMSQGASYHKVQIQSPSVETVLDAPRGFRSGLFRGGPGLSLAVNESDRSRSLFSPYAQWHGISIAFSLKVLDVQDGAEIFVWEHIPDDLDAPMQRIRVYIQDGIVTWDFQNIFVVNGVYTPLTIRADTVVVPRFWQFYQLSIDIPTARVHYFIDETLVMVDAIHRQENASLSAVVLPGIVHTFNIGTAYTGLLDEFLVLPRAHSTPLSVPMWKEQGSLTSDIIDLGEALHVLEGIDASIVAGSMANVEIFYRFSPHIVDFEARPWQKVAKNGNLPDAPRGRFVQLGMRWYADQLAKQAIRLESLGLRVHAKNPLPPPENFQVQVAGGNAVLSWDAVPMIDVDGYIIYLSKDPQLRHTQSNPLQVIDAGSVEGYTFELLDDDTAYFVAVGTYRDGEHESLMRFSAPLQFRIPSSR